MTDLIISASARNKRFEGTIPYFYLDTHHDRAGNLMGIPTIGRGHACRTVAEACKLPWDISAFPLPLVASEWTRVSQSSPGKYAAFYRDLTTCRLTDAQVDQIEEDDLRAFLFQLHLAFPQFDSYPSFAQQAVMDMAYNCGVRGLQTQFPKLTQAIRSKCWYIAADCCWRKSCAPSRNEDVRQLFRRAVTG